MRTRALLALLVASACSTEETTRVSPRQLLAAIDSGRPPVIVDVRTRREFENGHVPGAIHIPFYAIRTRRAEIPSPPDQPVVVYCEHGPRAGVAKLSLRSAGFSKVLYLEGHMAGWKKQGLPIER